MSYNVSVWKTKLIDNLRIPVAALYEGRDDWQPDRKEQGEKTEFDWGGDENYIVGCVVDDWLIVEEIKFWGVGSGYVLHDVIEPALKNSAGGLVAVRIWEGGDSIDRLIVCDGNLRTEDIDI